MSEAERKARRERLAALRDAGVDPFPARVEAVERIADVRARCDDRDEASLEADPVQVAIAGRLMSQRSFGKLMFLTLREDGAQLQVSARKGDVDPGVFASVRALDVGDFIRVEGALWRTRTGELTVRIARVQLLAKGLRPLPEKWHGLSDVETRFRQRYLDLLVTAATREMAVRRSETVRALRAFLDGRGFLEVETPILQPIYGGALARPFTTHHNAYDQQLYLRVSDELYLKRLVIGGLDRVYEVGRAFRNEGVSRKHNPEFTMMECYQAYADYRDMMDLTEAMVGHVVETVNGTSRLTYQEQEIDFTPPWPRRTLQESIHEAVGIDVLAHADADSLRAAMGVAGLDPSEEPTWALMVDDLISQYVEPNLIQPTFLVDYPVDLSPLAKRSPGNPLLVERFELFVAGMELANAFSELNDPDDQRQRFEAQRTARESGDEEAHPLDEDYLLALEHGMPPTGGLGVGVDRLVMLLTDSPTLREALLFPHVRPERG